MICFFRWLLILPLLFVAGCVPPDFDRREESVVTDEELLSVSLVREGLFFLSRSRFWEAELNFRQAIYLYPDLPSLKINLASALERLELYAEAIDIYNELIKNYPDILKYRLGLAHLLFTAQRYEESRKEYQTVLKEALPTANKDIVISAARSLSNISFKIGLEKDALCYSDLAYQILSNREQLTRHIKLLVALGYNRKAADLILAAVEKQELERSPELLEALIFARYGDYQDKESSELLALFFNLGKVDPAIMNEVKLVDSILNNKGAPSTSNTEDQRVFEGPKLLYWPARLVVEYLAATRSSDT